jgi:hypothetical protein
MPHRVGLEARGPWDSSAQAGAVRQIRLQPRDTKVIFNMVYPLVI